ncbi:GNAT family N-acetyltransferase [Nisaea sp.]|uniref:GNAT family N-acetyltransferase n=1 Tax=Nisaea sp. TaxID=2024842 RepID=UPI003B52A165
MPTRRILKLADASHHLEIVAGWNHAEWGAGQGYSLQDSVDWFRDIMRKPSEECMIAIEGAAVVGMASLVDHDLDSRPDLLHWLASVYVVPEQRGKGIAATLVAALEREATLRSIPLLHLYTHNSEALYAKLGWTLHEHFMRGTGRFALMTKKPAL